jgi:hypothetical protein
MDGNEQQPREKETEAEFQPEPARRKKKKNELTLAVLPAVRRQHAMNKQASALPMSHEPHR